MKRLLIIFIIEPIGKMLDLIHGSRSGYKLIDELEDLSIKSSAKYVNQYVHECNLFRNTGELWSFAADQISLEGLTLEFGVYRGTSINFFANRLKGVMYGFDSFEGLKQGMPGTDAVKGTFNLGGNLPTVLSNVKLIKGWFEDSLPDFLEKNDGVVSFLHLDADNYEPTIFVLNSLRGRIQSGTIIVFDEYLGYPGWDKTGEYLAWKEFTKLNNISFRYLAFSVCQTVVKVI